MTNTELKNLRADIRYDHFTGEFQWCRDMNGRIRAGLLAGGVDKISGYWRVRYNGKNYQAHRLAWLIYHGKEPDGVIDHIDGNKLNNAIANLRDVSSSVNLQNQKKSKTDNRVGLLGVSELKNGKFVARITLNKETKIVGYFTTPEEAHTAYLTVKRELHEGCTI